MAAQPTVIYLGCHRGGCITIDEVVDVRGAAMRPVPRWCPSIANVSRRMRRSFKLNEHERHDAAVRALRIPQGGQIGDISPD